MIDDDGVDSSWDARVAAVWDGARDRDEDAVVTDVEALVAERPADDPAARFELASARDFAGREDEAEPLYRAALAAGLDPVRRPQALIQLASTLRNLGRADEAAALLGPGADVAGHRDAATAFRALALTDLGRPREAVASLLDALASHLPQYAGAVRYYAAALDRAGDSVDSAERDTPVRLWGLLVCRDDHEAALVRQHLPRHVELTRAEDGCLSFEVTPGEDPLVWHVDERFRDADAFATHQRRVAASEWGRATAGIERRYETGGGVS